MRKRTSTFVLEAAALLLLGYSFLSASPTEIAQVSSSMLATSITGVSASVMPNAENSAAGQLAVKEAELDAREARLTDAMPRVEPLALYSFGLSLVLFALLTVNYVFDWRRGRKLSRVLRT